MKRAPLYSNSRRPAPPSPAVTPVAEPSVPTPSAASAAPFKPGVRGRVQRFYRRYEKVFSGLGSALVTLAIVAAYSAYTAPRKLTQNDIDGAVLHTLEKQPAPPSKASVAYDLVRPSVVRVNQVGLDETDNTEKAVGTGVVIDEKGTILTNIHVVAGADRILVTFADGTKSDAKVIGVQPKDDLAVLKPDTIPDDLKPATMVSTGGLKQGDEVVAVGFPFAIGPSVSSGVVSGLKREWMFDKDHKMKNLIQFDAAANPGNSGGPLVNRNGEVVGIVTGILNPTKQSFFVGIGFAVPIENAAKAVGQSPF